MVSDETAYRKYLAGDEAAAQLLVERYGDALTLYINGVLGDIHEAEDRPYFCKRAAHSGWLLQGLPL